MANYKSMDYIIIGNGVAGINAALTIRKRSDSAHITIISKETEYYYSRTALMYIAMGIMTIKETEPYERYTYRSQGINRIFGNVVHIDTKKKEILLEDQKKIHYDYLLLATGATAAFDNWPGFTLRGVVNLISYQDCQTIKQLIPGAGHAVVVGGGLIGVELCEVFRSYHMKVTFLIRDSSYWLKALSSDEGKFVERHIRNHGVQIITNDELAKINGINGKVSSITTKTGQEIPCDIVGIATGVKPEMSLTKNTGILCKKGIITNWKLQTSIPDIFAAGDCVEIEGKNKHFMQAIWYSARDMGITAGQNMCGDSLEFDPGEWYNSAMFFEKEYTVAGRYGKLQASEEEYLYQDKRHSIRIICENSAVKGFSMIGSRWNHQVLLDYIKEQRDLDYFLTHYKEAQFNPEFHSHPISDNRETV